MTLKASSSEYLSSGESRTEVANIIPGVFDVGLKSECSFSPLGVQILGTPFGKLIRISHAILHDLTDI
jgi:hypothetical protein